MQQVTENETQNKRIDWIDTAKLIGIYLMILGHLPIAGNERNEAFIITLVFSFHMPLFFFLSGYVEKNRPLCDTIKRSTHNLLIPYAIFYLLTYLWWLLISFSRHPELFERSVTNGFIKPFLGMLNGCGFDTDFSIMINVPLWFLMALFWCRFLNAFGNKLGRIGKHVICVVGIIVSIQLWKHDRFIPTSLGAACMAMPFYYAGLLTKKISSEHVACINAKTRMLFRIIILVCATAAVIGFTILNGRADMNGIVYGKNPLLFFAGASAGIIMTVTICSLLPSLPTIGKFLARNTITILALHSILNGILTKLYALVILHSARLGENKISGITGILIALINLSLLSIPCLIIERFFPAMLGRRKTSPEILLTKHTYAACKK